MSVESLGETVLADVPTTPGIYLMFGAADELLYVGKAKNLRTRLRSYARAASGDNAPRSRSTRAARQYVGKVTELVAAIREVRWEQWPSEEAARERETVLLRALRPPYNDTHTDRGDYLFITVSDADRGRKRFAMSAAADGGNSYGCFPFAAGVPDAFPALLRLLYLAHGQTPPTRLTRTTGCLVGVDDEVWPALHAYLSGRSPRLVTLLSTRLATVDELTARSVRRDLATLRQFYADGPRELRRLRLRHRMPAGPTTADQLHDLVAAQLRVDLGVDLHVRPRDEVERRVWAMYAEGRAPGRIAAALNADRVPRFGGGRWSIADVDRVVSGGGDRARYPM